MSSLRLVLVALLALGFGAGCGHGPMAQYRTIRRFEPVGSFTQSAVRPEAAGLVERARVVAFVAPKPCSAKESEARTAVLRLPCALLMAEFEAQAISNGFDVVDWRSLDGAPDAMAAGAAAGANLVFELSEAVTTIDPKRDLKATDTRYVLDTITATRQVGELDPGDDEDVARRCDDKLAEGLKGKMKAATFTVDLIDPTARRVVWRWVRTVPEAKVEAGAVELQHAARAESTSYATKSLFGALLLVSLIEAVLPPIISTAISDESAGYPVEFAITAAGLGVVGLVGLLAVPGTTYAYPAAEDALCEGGSTAWVEPSFLGEDGQDDLVQEVVAVSLDHLIQLQKGAGR